MNKYLFEHLGAGPFAEKAKLDYCEGEKPEGLPWGMEGTWVVREGLPELTSSDPGVLVLGRCEETRSVPGRGNSI